MAKTAFLTGKEILKAIEKGKIVVTPFDPEQVAQCSIDLHLSKYLLVCKPHRHLDLRKDNQAHFYKTLIPKDGYVIAPGTFLLASTIESIYAPNHLAHAMGKSSVARNALTVESAGLIEPGFSGHITLELFSQAPLRVYEGSPIAQVTFARVSKPESYSKKGNYTDSGETPWPQASRSFRHKLRHIQPSPLEHDHGTHQQRTSAPTDKKRPF